MSVDLLIIGCFVFSLVVIGLVFTVLEFKEMK